MGRELHTKEPHEAKMHVTLKRQTRKTVLIVDDDEANLKRVSGYLAGDYEVLTANTSKQALRRSRTYKKEIQVLLADLQLSGMSGIDLATQIALHRPDIKVLLMSEMTGGMLVLNDGWHFLPKPFIPSQLRGLIISVLSSYLKSKFKNAKTKVVIGPQDRVA
jgi:hypothetical protein